MLAPTCKTQSWTVIWNLTNLRTMKFLHEETGGSDCFAPVQNISWCVNHASKRLLFSLSIFPSFKYCRSLRTPSEGKTFWSIFFCRWVFKMANISVLGNDTLWRQDSMQLVKVFEFLICWVEEGHILRGGTEFFRQKKSEVHIELRIG